MCQAQNTHAAIHPLFGPIHILACAYMLRVLESVTAEIAEWLDHLTLVQKVLGLKQPSDLSLRVRTEFNSYL